MDNKEQFLKSVTNGYSFKGDSFLLGVSMLDKSAIPGLNVSIPLKTMNRHGLISGATGTGKTKTLQNIAERLSENGISSLVMDIKGDLSGLAAPGTDNEKIKERYALLGAEWKAASYPVEFLTLSEQKGSRLRATISEFGPVLLSKILNLNDNQSGVVSLVFKYCDDNGLLLLDLKDFKKALHYLANDGKEEIKEHYGAISTSTASVILRKLIELEEQGSELFFGELSFDVEDLMRIDENGRGYINILRLNDIQDKPKLFSTFMLSLLAEIYQKFPERGDLEKPELVIFIDEAHLIFDEASGALLDQIENVIKLIRSKGVGVFFCTQLPTDVPANVLSQLGLKIQHSLRAFTAKDRKAIKSASENYPETEYYEVDKLITEMGIGEAFITALNEKGIPTPLVHVMLTTPSSRMDILTQEEIDAVLAKSGLINKYNESIDRESAYELLTKKLEQKAVEQQQVQQQQKTQQSTQKKEVSALDKVSKNPLVKTAVREVTRGFFGMIKSVFK
ncbi:MAG TPA: helicase HerA-like domain-containing protein [Ignavibacteria bacterium]|nr:helicase HerA-like domain-containing protein [Ignavibacteria bacterium]